MFRRTKESDDNTRNGLSVIQGGQVHLRTLILLRWVAVAGQTATVLLVFFGLGFELPLIACFGAIFGLVSSNLVLASRGRERRRLTEREVFLLLGFDVLQLSVLLFLTGGLANPFVILIIVETTHTALPVTLFPLFFRPLTTRLALVPGPLTLFPGTFVGPRSIPHWNLW